MSGGNTAVRSVLFKHGSVSCSVTSVVFLWSRRSAEGLCSVNYVVVVVVNEVVVLVVSVYLILV